MIWAWLDISVDVNGNIDFHISLIMKQEMTFLSMRLSSAAVDKLLVIYKSMILNNSDGNVYTPAGCIHLPVSCTIIYYTSSVLWISLFRDDILKRAAIHNFQN